MTSVHGGRVFVGLFVLVAIALTFGAGYYIGTNPMVLAPFVIAVVVVAVAYLVGYAVDRVMLT